MGQRTTAKIVWGAVGLVTLAPGCAGQSPGEPDEALTERETANANQAPQAPGLTGNPNIVDMSAVPDLSEYMQPPGGVMMHKSCVHEVPDEAVVRRGRGGNGVDVVLKDGTSITYQPCTRPMVRAPEGGVLSGSSRTQPPFTNGWTAWSEAWAPWNSGYPWFKEIRGTWYVPANPPYQFNPYRLLYFFNGLQSDHEIIQPVLQWGSNGSFGGNGWVFASWHVFTDDGGGAYWSPVHAAAAGDYMDGDTWANNCDSAGYCNWSIRTYYWHDPSHNYSTTMNVSAFGHPNGIHEVFNRADQGVLENYNLTSCSQYPPDGLIEFFDTYVYQPKPTDISGFKEVWSAASWSASHASGTTCGQDANFFYRGVDITY